MDHTEEGNRVYEQFKKHLDERHFSYHPNDEDLTIMLLVHGEDIPLPTVIQVMDDRSVVRILSPFPFKMPEDKRLDAAVAVAFANYGIVNGSFDLDMNDGEIRFRIAQCYEGMELSDESVYYLLQAAFVTTDHYNDRFYALGKGNMSLEQFIDQENND